MKILGFDTSLGICSVALLEDDIITFQKKETTHSLQAEILVPLLEEALRSRKLEYADLDAIAVTKGPGSFTGVRIGLAAAQGISLVTNVPIFAASTLEVTAAFFKELVTVIQDAGRGMIYVQKFSGGKPLSEAVLLNREGFKANCEIIEVKEINPEILVRMAALRISETGDADKIAPVYIRPPDAKLPTKKCV